MITATLSYIQNEQWKCFLLLYLIIYRNGRHFHSFHGLKIFKSKSLGHANHFGSNDKWLNLSGYIYLNRVCSIAGIWQFSAILVIRYLLVFYQKLMNSVDENFVKRIARSFVTFTSIFFILISDLESTGIYQLMSITTGKVQKYGFNELFIIAAIICLIILIVTQYQIEMFRKSVDLRGRLHQLEVWHYEGEENQECNNESNNYYKMNTNRIILCLSLVVLVLVIGVGSKVIVRITGDLYNGWLQFTTVLHFILTIVIPMIFIIRNDDLYNLFKCQIIKFFKLCQK